MPQIDKASTAVVALPRGGLPVAAEIALALQLPLDIVLVRKVGAPGQPELALAAVTDGARMEVTINRDVAGALGLGEADVRKLARRELPELERRRKAYCGDRPAMPLAGKTVIVVDDGAATGATAKAALRLIRQGGARRIVLALPVAPADVLDEMKEEADAVICLQTPSPFHAVGAHYAEFDQVNDQEVTAILAAAAKRLETANMAGKGAAQP